MFKYPNIRNRNGHTDIFGWFDGLVFLPEGFRQVLFELVADTLSNCDPYHQHVVTTRAKTWKGS